VSRPRLAVTELPEAAREAALALLTSPRVRAGERRVEHFDDLGAERLLARVTDLDRLATMALEALGPLGDPGLPGRNELLTTLAALLAHNMRLADAVGELYFHYNTVRHRLARLRSLLGTQLEEPEERLGLALALTALRVVAVERPELAPAVFSAEPSAARTRPRSAPAGSPPGR
jgi:PucR family transcriptional regulator, purine catabolism regulatory protein